MFHRATGSGNHIGQRTKVRLLRSSTYQSDTDCDRHRFWASLPPRCQAYATWSAHSWLYFHCQRCCNHRKSVTITTQQRTIKTLNLYCTVIGGGKVRLRIRYLVIGDHLSLTVPWKEAIDGSSFTSYASKFDAESWWQSNEGAYLINVGDRDGKATKDLENR